VPPETRGPADQQLPLLTRDQSGIEHDVTDEPRRLRRPRPQGTARGEPSRATPRTAYL
jgi:hypothetical protein